MREAGKPVSAGDVKQGIPSGTQFEDLPDAWGLSQKIFHIVSGMEDFSYLCRNINGTIRWLSIFQEQEIVWPRPKTRYLIGFMAKPMVWMHTILPTRWFDYIVKHVS